MLVYFEWFTTYINVVCRVYCVLSLIMGSHRDRIMGLGSSPPLRDLILFLWTQKGGVRERRLGMWGGGSNGLLKLENI